MKAELIIQPTKNDKHIVIIDNGYGNTLTMTDELSFKECLEWIENFKNLGIKTQ